MRKEWAGLLQAGFPLAGLLIAVALWYARDRGVPLEAAGLLLPAFFTEALLYVLAGLPAFREQLQRLAPASLALLLTATAPLSYLLIAAGPGAIHGTALLTIVALAGLAAFWYVIVPRRLPFDLAFLGVMAAPVLLHTFDALYPDPARRIPGQVLGILMWYRTGLISVLCIRRMDGIGFGFLPLRREWIIGVRNYFWFAPPALLLALATGFIRTRDVAFDLRFVMLTLLTFAGVLWVLAVAEEFFFRGLLQQQLAKLFRSDLAG
ncbi:MAG: hypothetical protein H7039_01280, partial [Bryobacteraceae bacterium]|nr:hypothetical protein [Bryobacteraceae bacterium]